MSRSGDATLHWSEQGQARCALWRSEGGQPLPRRVVCADDTMPADTAYRLACEGTALLWRGDFQNARQLLQAMARRQGFLMSHALAGVYDFSGGVDAYQRLLRDWLVHAEAGDVLMCHPAVDAVPADPIATARVVEFHVLASDWMGELLSREHIRLAPLSPWLREHAALRAALDAPAAEPEEADIHTRI